MTISRSDDVTPMPSTGPIIRAEESSAYMPSTEEVKGRYAGYCIGFRIHGCDFDQEAERELAKAEFDRWLTEHDRELQARAWWLGREAGVKWAQGNADEPIANPYESEEK